MPLFLGPQSVITAGKTGDWQSPLWPFSATISPTSNQAYASMIVLPPGRTFQSIGIGVTGAGSAGTVVRLSVYDDDSGWPLNLLVDGGTVAGDAIAQPTVSVTGPAAWSVPRRVWAVAAVQAGTGPTLRRCAPMGSNISSTVAASVSGSVAPLATGAGVSGAMPATWPGTHGASNDNQSVMVSLQLS